LVLFTRRQFSPKSALLAGLRNNEFFMEYQPIIDLQTGTWVGVEALARWRRADGTMVRPDFFIPVAEEYQLIQQVTERVLMLVMREMPEMLRIDPHFYISINLSSADVQSEAFVAQLRDGLRNAGLRPANLHVEATERGFLNTDVGRRVIRDIRAMGVQVAIDDFGTGYSSLSYLETFDLDYLKIDKSFVDTMGMNAVTSQVALHIIGIAKSLGLQMIAEGVESEAQAQCLRFHGVQYAQGWLFGKPMSSGDIVRNLIAFKSVIVPWRVNFSCNK
jgi:sensor c-di-GMP phosphodiesterase-like protein